MFYIYAGNQLVYQAGNNEAALISPKLTVEFGKAGSLEFTIPSTNPAYDILNPLKTVITVSQDNKELFRGRILSNKMNFFNTRNVYAEGDLAYLVDSVQKAEKYSGKSQALFRKIIAAHNAMVSDTSKQFTVGNITVEDRDVYLAGKSEDITDKETNNFNYKQVALNSVAEEWQTTYDYIDKCLIEYCGGYLHTRRVDNTTYIDWIKDYSSTASQAIEVGRNVLDLNREINVEDLFTVLIPLGDENLTVEKAAAYNQNDIVHEAGKNEIVNQRLVSKYGRIVKTNVFDSVNTPATLLENGIRYLQTNADDSETFTITAVDLHLINPNIEQIMLGDKATIVSAPHGLSISTLTCTKIEYDIANPANTVYTFGKPKQTLTERYRKDRSKQADTASRGGGGGGGGAAAAAAEDAENNADKNVKEIFDAWITYDKDKALIDIGALYKKLHGIDKVTNEVGMKMDGKAGTVNLYADHESSVQNANNINKIVNKTGIKLDSEQGKVDIFADHKKWKEDREVLKSSVGIDLDAPESLINLNVVREDLDDAVAKIKKTLGIELNGKEGTVRIFSMATDLDNDKEHIASIQTWAGYNEVKDKNGKVIKREYGSNIALQADLVKIDARLTKITGVLEVGDKLIVHRYVDANGFYGKLFEKRGGEFYPVGDHVHKIDVNQTTGEVTFGPADKWGYDATNSFNIADTKFHQDAVSAVTPASANYRIRPDGSTNYGLIEVHNKDGKVIRAFTLENGYNRGVSSVGISSISVVRGGENWVTVNATLTNGVSMNRYLRW